jgi:L-aspartate oxidase
MAIVNFSHKSSDSVFVVASLAGVSSFDCTNRNPLPLSNTLRWPVRLVYESKDPTMIRGAHAWLHQGTKRYARNHGRLLSTTFEKLPEEAGEDRLLVIGSGVAGSAAALLAAETHQIPVTMIFAGALPTDCNSYWAQGGIIYRNYDPASGDSAALLASDIHKAGAGLCDDPAVQKVSEEGPDRVRELLLGSRDVFANVPFDRQASGDLSLCLEASHAAPRILYQADHTGRIITEHLTAAVARHPLIRQVPHTVVTDLIVTPDSKQCVGVQTLNRTTGQAGSEYAWQGTLLASGGLAGIYEHSTNPAGFNALGSSVALARRAGAAVQDLEYVQFHPTALYVPNEARFLLSEALRGEGAILRDASGRAFAKDYHPDGELAPRDVVARAVFEESQKGSDQHHNVFLDITHRDGNWLHQRFPSIHQYLSPRGLDLAKDLLPCIPAAHYTCGGVSTNLQGQTSVRGLYAAGEAARTGLHGGNRLASTSLLEGLVFGGAVADCVASEPGQEIRQQARQTLASREMRLELASLVSPQTPPKTSDQSVAHQAVQLLGRLRRTMWDYVGVTRTSARLVTAVEDLGDMRDEADSLYAHNATLETAALRDATEAGLAVARAAAANRTSGGAHCIVPDAEIDSDDDEDVAAAAR